MKENYIFNYNFITSNNLKFDESLALNSKFEFSTNSLQTDDHEEDDHEEDDHEEDDEKFQFEVTTPGEEEESNSNEVVFVQQNEEVADTSSLKKFCVI